MYHELTLTDNVCVCTCSHTVYMWSNDCRCNGIRVYRTANSPNTIAIPSEAHFKTTSILNPQAII